MDIRKYVKRAVSRIAKATRNGTPASHINKRSNKRVASKAARRVHIDPYDGSYGQYTNYRRQDNELDSKD